MKKNKKVICSKGGKGKRCHKICLHRTPHEYIEEWCAVNLPHHRCSQKGKACRCIIYKPKKEKKHACKH